VHIRVNVSVKVDSRNIVCSSFRYFKLSTRWYVNICPGKSFHQIVSVRVKEDNQNACENIPILYYNLSNHENSISFSQVVKYGCISDKSVANIGGFFASNLL